MKRRRTVYRLARGADLPLHWSYSDPWEWEPGEGWIDNRAPGFQAWRYAQRAVGAAAGRESDGHYTFAEYPLILSVRVADTYDGGGEWEAVRPEWVRGVAAVPSSSAVAWAAEQASSHGRWRTLRRERAIRRAFDARLDSWLQANESRMADWLRRHSLPVAVRWIETLPPPRRSR